MPNGEYGIIYKSMWRMKTFLCLSQDARDLLFFLCTGDPSNLIGLFYFHIYNLCGEPAFAVDGWEPDRAMASLNELIKYKWINYDSENKMLLINYWFDGRNIISTPQFKKACAQLANLPFTPLIRDSITQMNSSDCKLSQGFKQGLMRALKLRLPQDLQQDLPITETGTETGTETENGEADNTAPQKVTMDQVRKLALLFNKQLPDHPQVNIEKLSDNPTRVKHVKARLVANPDGEFWPRVFEEIKLSDWLSGKVSGSDGRKPFKVTFDWMINPANLIKIIEGNYRNGQTNNRTAAAKGGAGRHAKAVKNKYSKPRR